MPERTTKELDLHAQPMTLNMGPSHPAMHGTVRIKLELEGESILSSDVEVGYLHRCFEKESERCTWQEVIPYTDRLNYVSPLANNLGYCLAVEKLLAIEVPERAQVIRTLLAEMSRIADHFICIGAASMELGAFSVLLYTVEARDFFFDLFEELTGARVTNNFIRIGGLAKDLTEGWTDKVRKELKRQWRMYKELDALLSRNRVFHKRMVDVGVMSPEGALALGWTGPCLRSTGVDYDVRKDSPYLIYKDLDFDVPIGERGDNMDRYLVRMEEIQQSLHLVEQILDIIPEGPVRIDDWSVILPPKEDTYNSIEGMIAHFKLLWEGIQVGPGEIYSYSETPNGELGFYMVADGSGKPYRCHVRSPCFAVMQGLSTMISGAMVADIIPTFGSINMIGGECDR